MSADCNVQLHVTHEYKRHDTWEKKQRITAYVQGDMSVCVVTHGDTGLVCYFTRWGTHAGWWCSSGPWRRCDTAFHRTRRRQQCRSSSGWGWSGQLHRRRPLWGGKASWWRGWGPDSLPHSCWGHKPEPACGLPHLQPWPLLLCWVTPALQSPGLSSLQCEGAFGEHYL